MPELRGREMNAIHIDVTANYKTRYKRRNRLGRNSDGWIALVKLPFGLGMTLGRGMTGRLNVRSWEWAQYDYADHDPQGGERWANFILSKPPIPRTPLAAALETWKTKRTWTN